HLAVPGRGAAIDLNRPRRFGEQPPTSEASNLQLLRKTREDSATCLRDDDHVFLTRTAHAGIVQPRFDCEHLPIFQDNFLQARMFVDFQTEPVPGAVEKSDTTAVAHFGGETATGEEF